MFLAVLVAVHTVKNLALGTDWIETQHEQEEGYQSN